MGYDGLAHQSEPENNKKIISEGKNKRQLHNDTVLHVKVKLLPSGL